MAYTRAIFQMLAELRLAEARLLFRDYQPSGTYYFGRLRNRMRTQGANRRPVPRRRNSDRALINRVYTHDLPELVRLAGLETELKSALAGRQPPLVIDVRRPPAFRAAPDMAAGALQRDPAGVASWARELPRA